MKSKKTNIELTIISHRRKGENSAFHLTPFKCGYFNLYEMAEEKTKDGKVELTLKWGTLKSWDVTESARGQELMKEYCELGVTISAMAQRNTPRQKEIICELIDLCEGDILLEWGDECVSKEKAKEYVMNYGKPKQ